MNFPVPFLLLLVTLLLGHRASPVPQDSNDDVTDQGGGTVQVSGDTSGEGLSESEIQSNDAGALAEGQSGVSRVNSDGGLASEDVQVEPPDAVPSTTEENGDAGDNGGQDAQLDNANESAPGVSSDPAQDPLCLPVRGSAYCGNGWSDHYIDIQVNADTENTTGWLPADPSRQNIEEFDRRLSALIWNRSVALSEARYDCRRVLRKWFITYSCGVILLGSARCNAGLETADPDVGMRPVCSDTCSQGVESTRRGFMDESVCGTNEEYTEKRNRVLGIIEKNCTEPFASGSPGRCVSGEEAEPLSCGLDYIHQDCNPKLCEDAKDNPMCRDAPLSLLEDTRDSSEDKESEEALPPAAIMVVVFLLILGLLIFAVLYRCIHNAARSKKRAKTAARKPPGSNPSQAGSPFSPSAAGATMVAALGKGPKLGNSGRNVQKIGAPMNVHTQLEENRAMAKIAGESRTEFGTVTDVKPGLPVDSFGNISTSMGRGTTTAEATSKERSTNRSSSLFDKKGSVGDGHGADGAGAGSGGLTDPGQTDIAGAGFGVNPADLSGVGQYSAVRDYTPALNDEMELVPGDVITVSQKYDDGWAYGLNLSTGQLGVFPMGFVAPASPQDVADIALRWSVYGDHDRINQIKTTLKTDDKGQSSWNTTEGSRPRTPTAAATINSRATRDNYSVAAESPGPGSIAALMKVLDRIGDESAKKEARKLANLERSLSDAEQRKKAKEIAQMASLKVQTEEDRYSFSALLDVLNGMGDQEGRQSQREDREPEKDPFASNGRSESAAGRASEATSISELANYVNSDLQRSGSGRQIPPSKLAKSVTSAGPASNQATNGNPARSTLSRIRDPSGELDELDIMLKEEEERVREALSSLHKATDSY